MTIKKETLQEIPQEITEEITDELKEIIGRWKHKEGNLIMALHAIEKYYGYVPRNISMFLSQELEIPLARIYEVLTFYNFFKLDPPAKYTISICTGTACYLKGAEIISKEFKKQLGIKAGSAYTDDKKFKVEEVRCIGCCGLAPVLTVNEEVFGRVKPADVPGIIEKVTNGKE